MNRLKTATLYGFIGALSLAAMLLRVSANRGGLRNSREVGRAFEIFHAYPNDHYWYYNQEITRSRRLGWTSRPAEDIIGREVDPNSKAFEAVVGLAQDFPVRGSFTDGASYGPQAQQIGVWYSSLNAGIKVNPETKVISINAATPWVDDSGWYGSGVGVGVGSGGGGVGVKLGF